MAQNITKYKMLRCISIDQLLNRCFFSLCAKVCTEQDSIRSSRVKLFQTTAAETANSLAPMTVFVQRSTSVTVLADCRCRLPATDEASICTMQSSARDDAVML